VPAARDAEESIAHDVEFVFGLVLMSRLFRAHVTVNWVVVALFDRLTVPVNPFFAPMAMMVELEFPAGFRIVEGVAVIVNPLKMEVRAGEVV